ncbi:hypothetical protein K6W37_04515 [Acetobacter senegalensis]|uniref:hypothetical protein n=1 Tax=Acetobacter senegalensis TaxID=446692 RepID=UPI001ED9F809|nr:hypothetical protein [Acetobacter senegalensis]MCG4253167.1 hypothetical protein [Acetobacter senegalensis]
MTANGNPVFETVGGDVSAATVSPDGGKTSQTLAALAQGQNTLAGNVADAVQDASDAKAEAAQATENAQAATTAANDAKTGSLPVSARGTSNGVAALSGTGSVFVSAINGDNSLQSDGSTAYLFIGEFDKDNNPTKHYGCIEFGDGTGSKSSLNSWNNGATDWAAGKDLALLSASLHPADATASGAALGRADHAWSNIYSQKAVTVVSDLTDKTVLAQLGVTSYPEGELLAKTLLTIPPIAYQLNSSITLKGADKARIHFGYGAQTVRDAIKAAGLDPSKYALWTQTQRTTVTQVDSGHKDADGNPITVSVGKPTVDASGQPVYIEMLVYEQIHTLLVWYVNKAVADLATRVTALEAKAAGGAA